MMQFIVYRNVSKIKSTRCAGINGGNNLSALKIFEAIRSGESDFSFIERYSKIDLTESRSMNILKSMEPKNGDPRLLRRIIRGGGLIEYIKKLEVDHDPL